ncbi:MAG: hypothetical protein ABSD03_13780 [Vulcanimicrobiaceae bacterium]|jgi:hypothetical protein
MKSSIVVASIGAALILAATAQSPSPSAPLVIKLLEENKSGETGTATLRDTAGGLVVVLALTGGDSKGPQPAHIHFGVCDKLDKVDKPLKNVVDGASTTTIPDVTIAELAKVPHAINVHHSTTDVATYVACGNLPQAK